MKTTIGLLMVLGLVACAPEPVAPTQPAQAPAPAQTPPPAPASTFDFAAAQAQAIANQQAAIEKAMADAKANQQHWEDVAAAKEKEKQEKIATICNESRDVRLADVQKYVRAEVEFRKRTDRHAKAISARCRIPETARLANDSRVGLTVRIEQQKPVCKGGNPGGLSADDVYIFLVRDMGADASGIPVRSENSDADRMNEGCKAADTAAGLNMFVPQGDLSALEALLNWKP